MKYGIQHKLYHLTILIEAIIGIFLIIGVMFSIVGMANSMDFVYLMKMPSYIVRYLNTIATIVLCIEFTKMLCTHSLDSVVEVLSMAIAREIIAHETTAMENLLGVIAIAILFIIRKYCFISQLDKSDEHDVRSIVSETLHDYFGHKRKEFHEKHDHHQSHTDEAPPTGDRTEDRTETRPAEEQEPAAAH